MLPKIYSHKPPLADVTPKRRSLWARSCRPADRNMSVSRPAGSSSKAPLQIISIIMVFFNCLFVLCCFCLCYVPLFLFFSKTFATKTVQIKGLMQYIFYNPEGIHAFRIIKSENPQWHFGRWSLTKGLAGWWSLNAFFDGFECGTHFISL